ncbi:hypothetical protein [Nodosilinea sp. E11]|uniref:hypothetical protein n=1 Tax=Nodosilinea sp. E11 TaxID=3037479 RepID=UPI002934E249|nr:hypothetical protein [Nodosilinea sp. E11]WOD39210.1 hypothetical protein RRF56_23675 [Nodosilinea sp. E11]
MTAQMTRNKAVVAVFDTRREADQAKQTVQASGLEGQRISIDDHVSPSIQVAAQGTTVGGQAGLLMGAALGGVVGLIATIIVAFWVTGGYPDSSISRLAILGSTIAGAFFGAPLGKTLQAKQPADQKSKGNPDVPRQFRLVVEGSQEDVRQAKQALGHPSVAN